jgi:hypothetical protein
MIAQIIAQQVRALDTGIPEPENLTDPRFEPPITITQHALLADRGLIRWSDAATKVGLVQG